MALLTSVLSSAVEAKESEPRKRLSLAVVQLDRLIDRLKHLSELTNQSIPPAKEDQPLPRTPPLVVLPKQDN